MYHHKHADHNSDSQSGWGRCHAHFRAHNAGPHQSALPPLNASAGQAPYPSSANDSLPGSSHPAAAPPTGPAMDPWAAEKERMMEIGKQVGVNVRSISSAKFVDECLTIIVGNGVLGKHSGYIVVKYRDYERCTSNFTGSYTNTHYYL